MHEALLAAGRAWVKSASTRSVDDPIGLVELRRATSNAYYALFHAIAAEAANLLAGQDNPYWARVYRSLEHRRCKSECLKAAQPNSGHSPPIRACANSFASLQDERHRADYDPRWMTDPLATAMHIDTSERAMPISNYRPSENVARSCYVCYFRSGRDAP